MENNNGEKDMTVRELSDLMLKSFGTAQKHVNERFQEADKKFEILTEGMNKNFSEVKKQIDDINRNSVDVVHKEEFDKLELRVEDVEEVLDLKLKKA